MGIDVNYADFLNAYNIALHSNPGIEIPLYPPRVLYPNQEKMMDLLVKIAKKLDIEV